MWNQKSWPDETSMDYMKITYATLTYTICFDNVLCTINLPNHNSHPANDVLWNLPNEEDLKYLTLIHTICYFRFWKLSRVQSTSSYRYMNVWGLDVVIMRIMMSIIWDMDWWDMCVIIFFFKTYMWVSLGFLLFR